MREIEYRAWLKDEKKMVIVDAINFKSEVIFCTVDKEIDGEIIDTLQIIPFKDIELLEYTVLKDKNGVKIFEGDILKYPDNDEKDCIGVVEYGHFNCSCCHAVFGFTTINNKGWEIDMLVNDKEQTPSYEVIGNIYENPELLESFYE